MAFVFLSFVELVLDGGWNEESKTDLSGQLTAIKEGRAFRANGPSDLRIVEPEVMIRRFRFGTNEIVLVGNGVVSFDSNAIKDELTVDDVMRTPDKKRLRFGP
jgi:hypothetical protein